MNNPQPLVSVITIVYNGDKHLEQTIQSVLNQTYPHIEYIIIDGGSTDNTVSIIEKYSHRLAYWISEKDNGISDAFNKGISKANGEIVGIINADDWYETDAVENVASTIKNYDVAYGNMMYWKNGEKDMVVHGRHDYLKHEMTLNHPTVFVKKYCYDQHGLFNNNIKFAMDYDLLLRFLKKGCSFIHIPFVLANMRWEGKSDQQWYGACKETWEIKNKYFPKKRLQNGLYFLKQITAIALAKSLQQIHLGKIVQLYRSKLSPVRKTYH